MTVTDFRPVAFPAWQALRRILSMRDTSEGVPETRPRAMSGTGLNSAPGLRLADGRFLAAGLIWEKASFSADLPQIGTARPRLKHGDRIARATDRDIPSHAGSLLLALGGGLIEALSPDDRTEGLWLFTAELDDAQDHSPPQSPPHYWTALAELKQTGSEWMIQPLPRAEALHGSHATAIEAISEHMGTVDLAGIAICARQVTGGRAPEDRKPDDLASALALCSAPDPSLVRRIKPHPEGLPVFKAPFNVSVRTAGVASLAGAGLLTATLTLPQLVAAAFRAPPPPAPELVPVAPEPGGFAQACVSGLTTWWPRVTGWQAAGGGCALPRHLPPGLEVRTEPSHGGTMPLIIWQRLTHSSDANAVLAREAATHVLRDWTGGKTLAEDGLLLWKARDIALVEMDRMVVAHRDVPVPADDTRARLAAIWAHLPNAVRATDTADTTPTDSFIIQVPDAPGDLFARAARVPGLEPVRLDLSTGGQGNEGSVNTLHLSPVTPRLVPKGTETNRVPKGTETNRVPVSPTSVQGTSP